MAKHWSDVIDQQEKIAGYIVQYQKYVDEEKRIAAEEAQPCSQVVQRLGSCAWQVDSMTLFADENGICSGNAGWNCLSMVVGSFMPVGDMLEAILGPEILGGDEGLLGGAAAKIGVDGTVSASGVLSDLEAANAKLLGQESGYSKVLSCLTNSFAGTTPVLMADGTSKPISQVKVGDKIADNLPGADPGTTDQAHTVTAVHITYTDRDYTDVTVATPTGAKTITGTAHHLYWDVTQHAWTEADDLRPGDQLQTSDAHTVRILALTDYVAAQVTYNLTIDDLHTYYVEAGTTPVLVHNGECYGPGRPGPLPDTVAQTFTSGAYEEVTTTAPTTLYRVYGGTASEMGGYWSRTLPGSSAEAVRQSALDPAWGNTAERWVSIEVPEGTTFYEGTAAPQGALPGGGSQVFFTSKVDPAWVTGRGAF